MAKETDRIVSKLEDIQATLEIKADKQTEILLDILRILTEIKDSTDFI